MLTAIQRKQLIQLAGNYDGRAIGQLLEESLGQPWPVGPGAGIRSAASIAAGSVCRTSVVTEGELIRSSIALDLTGLASSTTDADIIGLGTGAAYLGQWKTAVQGTPFAVRAQCLEVPAGGVTDIDFFYAAENTGVFDGGIAALTETSLLAQGGAWTLALWKAFADPAALDDKFIYAVNGAAGTPATYTAGKFLLEFLGYKPFQI